MGLEDLPLPIREHITQTVGADYPVRPGSYHVTELLYCMRKSWLRRVHPEERKEDLGRDYNLYRGRLFDKAWTPLFRRHQIRVTHRIPGGPVIVGNWDFIYDGAVWDLKTIKNMFFIKKSNEPHEADVRQVQFYTWMENMTQARLAYVDLGDALVFPVESSEEALVENLRHLESRALTLHNLLEAKRPPDPEGLSNTWECGYCEMKPHCDVIEGIADPTKQTAIDFDPVDPDQEVVDDN